MEEDVLGKGYDLLIEDAIDEIQLKPKAKPVMKTKVLPEDVTKFVKEEEVTTHDQKK